MARVKTGTKDIKKMRVLKSVGGVRKVRCMKCGELVIEMAGPTGKNIFKCVNCGVELKFVEM